MLSYCDHFDFRHMNSVYSEFWAPFQVSSHKPCLERLLACVGSSVHNKSTLNFCMKWQTDFSRQIQKSEKSWLDEAIPGDWTSPVEIGLLGRRVISNTCQGFLWIFIYHCFFGKWAWRLIYRENWDLLPWTSSCIPSFKQSSAPSCTRSETGVSPKVNRSPQCLCLFTALKIFSSLVPPDCTLLKVNLGGSAMTVEQNVVAS